MEDLFIQNLKFYTIFTTKEEVLKFRKSKTIKINEEEISILFLQKILEDETFYQEVYRIFKNDTSSIQISFLFHGDIGYTLRYSKSGVIRGLEKLYSHSFSSSLLKRYQELKQCCCYENLFQQIQGTTYSISIDNKNYTISISDLLQVLTSSIGDYQNACRAKEVYGMKKEYFFYALSHFCFDYHLFDKFLFSSDIYERYYNLKNSQSVDIEAINEYLSIFDTVYQKVSLELSVREKILENMPSDFSVLEKAIYIYIKMCQIFTYDEKYYLANQEGESEHQDILYLSSIEEHHFAIVCFEFNAIYSKFLSELGICFASDYQNSFGEAYGSGHVVLNFRFDKFLISADAVTSILNGDLAGVKFHHNLVGLQCTNKNQETVKEFSSLVTSVYQMIQEQDHDFVSHLEEYLLLTKQCKEVSLEEKRQILFESILSTSMRPMDTLGYVIHLKKILFSSKELEENVRFVILKSHEKDQDSLCVLFAFHPTNFKEHSEQIRYYQYSENQIVPISQEVLQKKMQDHVFEFIGESRQEIPGILMGEKLKC